MTNRVAVQRFQALGDEQRLAIVELLREHRLSVGEIADALPVSRPAVSRHLRLLKDAGVVDDTPAGARRIYALRAGAVEELARYLDGMWDDALRRFVMLTDNTTGATDG